jgi:hypothetical protein
MTDPDALLVERLRHDDEMNLKCVRMRLDDRDTIYLEAAERVQAFLLSRGHRLTDAEALTAVRLAMGGE